MRRKDLMRKTAALLLAGAMAVHGTGVESVFTAESVYSVEESTEEEAAVSGQTTDESTREEPDHTSSDLAPETEKTSEPKNVSITETAPESENISVTENSSESDRVSEDIPASEAQEIVIEETDGETEKTAQIEEQNQVSSQEQNEKPEEKDPEEKASEEKKPEEKASEEKAPEEKAPEEKAPEEKVPEEKEPEEKTSEKKEPGEKEPEENTAEEKSTDIEADQTSKLTYKDDRVEILAELADGASFDESDVLSVRYAPDAAAEKAVETWKKLPEFSDQEVSRQLTFSIRLLHRSGDTTQELSLAEATLPRENLTLHIHVLDPAVREAVSMGEQLFFAVYDENTETVTIASEVPDPDNIILSDKEIPDRQGQWLSFITCGMDEKAAEKDSGEYAGDETELPLPEATGPASDQQDPSSGQTNPTMRIWRADSSDNTEGGETDLLPDDAAADDTWHSVFVESYTSAMDVKLSREDGIYPAGSIVQATVTGETAQGYILTILYGDSSMGTIDPGSEENLPIFFTMPEEDVTIVLQPFTGAGFIDTQSPTDAQELSGAQNGSSTTDGSGIKEYGDITNDIKTENDEEQAFQPSADMELKAAVDGGSLGLHTAADIAYINFDSGEKAYFPNGYDAATMKTVIIHYKDGTDSSVRRAFCVDHYMGPPADKDKIRNFSEFSKMSKLMFYNFGGPGFDLKIGGESVKDIMQSVGLTDDHHFQMMSHLLLAWQYCLHYATEEYAGMSPEARAADYLLTIAQSGDGYADAAGRIVRKINSLSTSAGSSLSDDSDTVASGKTRSKTFTWNSDLKENTLSISVPAGTTLVTGKTRYEGKTTAQVEGGASFFFEKDEPVKKKTIETYRCEPLLPMEYSAVLIPSSALEALPGYSIAQPVMTASAGQGTSFQMQITWDYEEEEKEGYVKAVKTIADGEGTVVLSKASAAASVTDGIRASYSNEGAVFTLTGASTGRKFTLTTGSDGKTAPQKVPADTYAVKEITAPAGFQINNNIPDVKVGPDKTPSPRGIVFVLTNQSTNKEYSLTIGNNGESPAVKVPEGTYSVKETNVPEGLQGAKNIPDVRVTANNTENNVKTFTVTNTQKDDSDTVTVTDQPIFGEIGITLYKAGASASDRTSAGAEFEIRYYGGATASGTPLRSWKCVTKDSGRGDGSSILDPSNPVSGDPFRMNGKVVYPLGTYTITETKSPAWMRRNEKTYTIRITQQGDHAVTAYAGFEADAYHSLTQQGVSEVIPEDYLYGRIKIRKTDSKTGQTPQGDASFAGAVFEVVNNNSYKVTAGKDRKKAFAKGETVTTITVDETGTGTSELLQSGTYIVREKTAPKGYKLSTKQLTVTIPDQDGALADCTLKAEDAFTEEVKRGGFKLEKQDLELFFFMADPSGNGSTAGGSTTGGSTAGGSTTGGSTAGGTTAVNGGTGGTYHADHYFGSNSAQGDAKLSGAQFELYNASAHDVFVNGTSYAPGARIEVSNFVTDDNASYTSQADLLPYGTYRIREVRAPEGYNLRGRNLTVTFSIREDGQMTDLKTSPNVIRETDSAGVLDEVIRFDVDIVKLTTPGSEEYQESGDLDDAVKPLEGITFELYLASAGENHAEPYVTIVTDSEGRATTRDPQAWPHGRLPYGVYRVHEVPDTIPEGISPVKDFYVDGTNANGVYDGKVYSGIFLNDVPLEEFLQIVKVDEETGEVIPCAGTVFELYRNASKSDGGTLVKLNDTTTHKKVSQFVTDESGSVYLPQRLSYGTYYIHEVQAPEGYLWHEDISFKVTSRNDWENVIAHRFADHAAMGIVQIKKKDTQTGEAIDGAEFAIIAAEDIRTADGTIRLKAGDLADTVTIGNAGKGTGRSGKLYLGSYYAVETRAPEGYALDSQTRYPFELTYDAQTGTDVIQGKDPEKIIDEGGSLTIAEIETGNQPTTFNLLKVEKKEQGEGWSEEENGPALDGITFRITRTGGPDMDRFDNGNVCTGGTFVTENGGQILVQRLASGTYSIEEISTLPGYILDKTVHTFTVDGNGFIRYTGEGTAPETGNTSEPGTAPETGNTSEPGTAPETGTTPETGNTPEPGTAPETGGTPETTSTPETGNTLEPGTAPETGNTSETTSTPGTTSTPETGTTPGTGNSSDWDDPDDWNDPYTGKDGDDWDFGDDDWFEGDLYSETFAGAADRMNSSDDPSSPDVTDKADDLSSPDGESSLSFTWRNVYTRWNFSKKDMGGQEIPGASMQVRTVRGEVIESWTSTGTPHRINHLAAGSYVLHEEAPAAGYTVASDIPFTVTDTGVLCSVSMTDKKLIVRKTDIMGREVPGAELAVYEIHVHDGESYVSEEPVDQWVSTSEPHEITGLAVGQSYRLTEIAPAEGYVLAQSVDFTVTDDGVDQTVILVNRQKLVLKTDAGIHALAGAFLEVVEKESGKSVDHWVSGGEVHQVNGLTAGHTYILMETKAPEGYVLAAPVEFTVTDDLSAQDAPITLINKQVSVSKTDLTGGKELPGARLTVTEKSTGKVCDHWTSKEEPHPVSGLKVGETYLLTEELAPEGYVRSSETIEFTVTDDFADQKVAMKDKQVLVTKQEIAGGPEIEGASLQVTEKESGKTTDTWISGKAPHPVSGLVTGNTYVLTETIPAPGYATANSITFRVDGDGVNTQITMEDEPTTLRISKKDLVKGKSSKELPGAKLEIRDADGKVIEAWISASTPHEIKYLPVGLYTLTEITAPDGYATAETIAFEVRDTGKIQSVTMFDAPIKVQITKTDITDSTPLPGAVLEVRDSKGKRIERWTTTKKPHMIERLPVGKYTLTEITAPKGYEVAETISFEVKDTGEIQKVEMKDKPVRETKDEKGGKKPDEEKGGNGKETNEAKGENEDKKKETEKAAGGGSAVSSAAGTSEAPRTGDDTDPVGPAAALILSLLMILGILIYRRALRER